MQISVLILKKGKKSHLNYQLFNVVTLNIEVSLLKLKCLN